MRPLVLLLLCLVVVVSAAPAAKAPKPSSSAPSSSASFFPSTVTSSTGSGAPTSPSAPSSTASAMPAASTATGTGTVSASGTGTDVFSTGTAAGPAVWISTNSTCPWPSLGTPDLFLDVPHLTVGKLELSVEDLAVKVSVTASVANIVNLNLAVEASVAKTSMSLAGIAAALRLESRLDAIVAIINRTLASIDVNPALVASVAAGLVRTIDPNLLASFTTLEGNVQQSLDSMGNIVQRVFDPVTGLIKSQAIVGSYLTMQKQGDPVAGPEGTYVQQYVYQPFGTLVQITFNQANQVIGAQVVQPTAAAPAA